MVGSCWFKKLPVLAKDDPDDAVVNSTAHTPNVADLICFALSPCFGGSLSPGPVFPKLGFALAEVK